MELSKLNITEVPSYTKELGTRISEVSETIGGRKSAALAAGISPDSLQRYIRGEVQPPFIALVRLCIAANCSIEWLATNEGSMRKCEAGAVADSAPASLDPDEYCYMPLYDTQINVDPGALSNDEYVVERFVFKQSWLREEMGLRSPKKCFLIPVVGDSMEPTLRERDIVMVYQGKLVISDGIYCLRTDNGLVIKRLQRFEYKHLKVISDNQSYEPFLLDDEFNVEDIIGRVVWAWKRI